MFACRLLISLDREIFTISADEPASLAVARTLSGNTPWNMFGFATWQPGLALLLVPFHWLTSNPTHLLRIALTLNCVIGALSAVVLARVLDRITAVSRATSTTIAFVVAVAPTAVAASSYVWAEPLVSLTFLLALLALMRLYAGGCIWNGIAAVASSAAGFLAHDRLLPLFVVTSGLAIAHTVGRRRWKAGAWLAAFAAASIIGIVAISDAVVDNVWERPAEINSVGSVLARMDDPSGILLAAVGQVWYQLVATIGIVGLGVGVACRAALGRDPDLDGSDARLVVALTTPLLALSALYMSSRPRVDHAIYGRYNDAILWPLVGVGLAWLIGRTNRNARGRVTVATTGSIIATIAVGGAVLHWQHRTLFETGVLARDMVPGVAAYASDSQLLDIARISVVAAILVTVLMAGVHLAPRYELALFAPLLALIIVGGIRTRTALGVSANEFISAQAVVDVTEIVPRGTIVGYHFDPNSAATPFGTQALHANLYQWFLPHNEFEWDWGPDDAVGPFVFAPVDNSALLATGARIVWRDPTVGLALWEEAQLPRDSS